MGCPEDRCGFTLDPEEVLEDWDGNVEEFYEDFEVATCYRETWRDGWCVWHAEVEAKPLAELKAARAGRPEQLDGVYLVGVDTSDSLSFQSCRLRFANFSAGKLPETRFPDADLRGAKFPDADLRDAEFRDADLRNAKFPAAVLTRVEFPDANLWGAEFHNTDLRRAMFPEANLSGAEFPDAGLKRAKFPKADLRRATFPKADLTGAEFPEADLRDTEFPEADVTDAELIDATARRVSFAFACLEDARLTRADLRGADFSTARYYQSVLADARITDATNFGDRCAYEDDSDATVKIDEDTHRLEAAAWTYRRLQSLHEQNAMAEEARRFHQRKEEVERKLHRERIFTSDSARDRLSNLGRYLTKTLNWRLTRHGESLAQVLKVATITIFACGLLYPFVGGINSTASGGPYRIMSLADLLEPGAIVDIGYNLYFSIITFTTIGYGDFYPAGDGSRILVAFESLSGAILIALFVFVLGRQVAR